MRACCLGQDDAPGIGVRCCDRHGDEADDAREIARNIARNLAANMVQSIRPEACIDRRGRLMGNLTGLHDLALLRLHP